MLWKSLHDSETRVLTRCCQKRWTKYLVVRSKGWRQRWCRLEGANVHKEGLGFFKDGLIFEDDVIAGLGVRDYKLDILHVLLGRIVRL